MKNITKSFLDYFDMVPATTDALKDAVYRLRYQVFCLEAGVFDAKQYPDGLEKDEYDAHSRHYLIRHRKTGIYAATTRLILRDPKDVARPFPIERYCRFDRPDLLDKIPRDRMAEVSRFCVSRYFKRRPGEPGTVTGISVEKRLRQLVSEDERRTWPHLTLALIACLHKINVTHNTTHWYAMIEPSLFRLLGLLGIEFTPIGPLTECYGKRQPCIIKVPEYLDRVKKKNRHIWDMLTDYGRFWRDSGESDARPPSANTVGSSLGITIRGASGTR